MKIILNKGGRPKKKKQKQEILTVTFYGSDAIALCKLKKLCFEKGKADLSELVRKFVIGVKVE